MSTYRCLSCGVSERRVPAREAELIRGGWLNLCRNCAADNLAEQVAEIANSIRDLSRDADDYAAAGLLPGDLEAQINALVDAAKQLTTDDEPTERLGTLDDLIDRLADLTIRSAS